MSWNIAGLRSKLVDSSFLTLILQYDIIILLETWESSDDAIKQIHELSSHTWYCSPSKISKRGGRNMGGVLVGIRNCFCAFVAHVNCLFEAGLVLNIDKRLFKTSKNIILIATYIAPDSSPAYDQCSVKGIAIIENLLCDMNYAEHHILLAGDLNARTGQEPDYIDVNTNLQIFQDLEEIFFANPSMR